MTKEEYAVWEDDRPKAALNPLPKPYRGACGAVSRMKGGPNIGDPIVCGESEGHAGPHKHRDWGVREGEPVHIAWKQ